MEVSSPAAQRIADMFRQDGAISFGANSGRCKDALSDCAAVSPGQPSFLFFLSAGDHQTGYDFHLAEDIPFIIVFIGLGIHVLVRAF